MSRRGNAITTLILLLLSVAAAPHARARADDRPLDEVEAYLARIGLHEVLALHLEELLEQAGTNTRRAAVAGRLAEVYARLLASEIDDSRRQAIQARSGDLLRDVPETQSLGLRLGLAQSAYSQAEGVAERWRMGRATEAEARSAQRTFTELLPKLASIADNARARVELYEVDEERSGGSEFITNALAEARRHRSVAHFLAGWCSTYVSELDPSAASGAASTGLRHFGALLDARPGAAPTIGRIKRRQLQYEHVARSVIGVALCESARGNADEAMGWLELLESEVTIPESVRRQLLARKLIVLARAERWGQIASAIHRRIPRGGQVDSPMPELTLTEARLLAVLALAGQDDDRSGLARSMAQLALASLAIEGQIGQLIDLIDSYLDGVRRDRDGGGFLAGYLRGIREYERARERHQESGGGMDEAATDAEALRSFRSAMRFLDRAVESNEANRFQRALPGAMLLSALAHFYTSASIDELLDAARRLARAAQALGRSDTLRAGGAYRLAVVAIDRAIELDPDQSLELGEQRREIVAEFLARHRDHPAAAAYLFQRATSGVRSTEDAVRDLLSIPESSEIAGAAYHEAARLLYKAFTRSSGAGRVVAGEEFLGVAERLLARDRARILAGDVSAQERASINARRILDCELSLPVPNIARVSLAYDLLEILRSRELMTEAGTLAELRYRAVQLALLRGRFDEAEEAARQLALEDPDLASDADRLLFSSAAARWRMLRREGAASSGTAQLDETAQRAMIYGRRVLDSLDSSEREHTVPSTVSLMTTLAELGSSRWFEAGDEDGARLAISLLEELRASFPSDTFILETAATLHDSLGQREAALECFRDLLAGYEPGSDEWFDVKTRLIEILAETDPARARQILAQHVVLYPELGPEPFRSRLRQVRRRLEGDAGS